MGHSRELHGKTGTCGRATQISCLVCSLLCRSSSNSWPRKACLRSFTHLTCIQMLVFFTIFREWIFSYDVISTCSWCSCTVTDWSKWNSKTLVTVVLMALAKPGPVELTWKGGGLLCKGKTTTNNNDFRIHCITDWFKELRDVPL